MSLKDIIAKIKEKTGLSEDEILRRIENKQRELENLVTKEGAAILVAKELGLSLNFETQRRLQISNLVPGLRNVKVAGRIFKITKPIEFEKNGSKGRLVKLYIGDESGYFILTLWNDQVDYVMNGMLKIGDVVEVKGGLVKENIYGEVEMSLGKFGIIRKTNLELPSEQELEKLHFQTYRKEAIKNLKPGNFEVTGTVVHIFSSSFVFEFCPSCKARIEANTCPQHGSVVPVYSIIINCILDDETSNIRCVFFDSVSRQLLGLSAEQLLRAEDRQKLVEEKLLGSELIVRGRVRKNPIFNRLELIADSAEYLNIDKATKELAAVVL